MNTRTARVIVGFLVLCLLTSTVIAASPLQEFVGLRGTIDQNGDLVIQFVETGLESGQAIDYSLTSDVTALYACSRGGRIEDASRIESSVTATTTLTSTMQGTVFGSITLMAPDSGSFMCRSGATLFLKGIRYDNAALTDITNSVTISSTQSFRRIFPTP